MAPGEELTCVTCRALTPSQRSAVLASYLGWTVDAFDFFILVLVMDDIAKEFDSRRAPASRLTEKRSVQTNKGLYCIGWTVHILDARLRCRPQTLEVEGSTFAMTAGWGQMPLSAKEFLGCALQQPSL